MPIDKKAKSNFNSEPELIRKHRMSLVGFLYRLRVMFTQPVFFAITFLVFVFVLGSSTLIYFIEHDINPDMNSFLNAIWWSVTTITTVGYGDVLPITPAGKIVGILMMLAGTGLFCCYTALFAAAILSENLDDVDTEMILIERRLKKLTQHQQFNEENFKKLQQRINNAVVENKKNKT